MVAGGALMVKYNSYELFAAVNTRYNDTANVIMYYTTWIGQAEVIIPVLALVMLIRGYGNLWYFVAASVSNLVPLLIEQLLKTYFNTQRPLKYFYHPSWIHVMPDWAHLYDRSFPSGHSEGAFSFMCFLGLILSQRYKKWGFLFFLLGLSVCYSRMYLAAHFFKDVYVGSIIGVVVSTIIFSILNHYKGRFFKEGAAQ